MIEPTRTCAGCGRKARKGELMRFVSADGVLIAGEGRPGRGVYTCRRLACFERATSRSAFSRALRQTVRVDAQPTALYTDR